MNKISILLNHIKLFLTELIVKNNFIFVEYINNLSFYDDSSIIHNKKHKSEIHLPDFNKVDQTVNA